MASSARLPLAWREATLPKIELTLLELPPSPPRPLSEVNGVAAKPVCSPNANEPILLNTVFQLKPSSRETLRETSATRTRRLTCVACPTLSWLITGSFAAA